MATESSEQPHAGAPKGNQNAVKSKRIFANALKRLFTQKPEMATELAEKLVGFAVAGEGWAFKELLDRVDGKVPQPIVGDDDEAPISIRQRLVDLVKPDVSDG